MRVLLFTGKGGVGKTTLAAATAARIAARDGKALVVSTDPAHSLADAFGAELGADPSEVDRRLYAAQVDSRGLVDSAWQGLRGKLNAALAGTGIDALDAEELTVLPGVDEVLALTEVQRLVHAGPWDTVVVDCGPTAETLRLLALPDAVAGYVDRLAGRSRLAKLFSTSDAESMRRLRTHVGSLRELLTDPATTTVRLVLTPERVVVAEARRTLSSLALRGIGVDELIVNRVMPAPRRWGGSAGSWLRERRRQQDEVLAELDDVGFDGTVRTVRHRAVEPVGLPALREIATELYGDSGPLTGPPNAGTPLLQMSEVDGGYRLRVALPLGADAVVGLARVDDDLAVTIDGFRRLIALPELLRPCRVTEAETDDDGVVVHLVRDDGGRDDR